MIEGLARHDTETAVKKNFLDSHGQPEVAFAFCHLLGPVRCGSFWFHSALIRVVSPKGPVLVSRVVET
jgi:hypothetical protein